MNVVVCVKQIPDPAVPGALEADHTLDRSGKLILDESDSYGVEMALQLVDAAGGGVAHELRGRGGAVRAVGVGVEVDAHAGQPSSRHPLTRAAGFLRRARR